MEAKIVSTLTGRSEGECLILPYHVKEDRCMPAFDRSQVQSGLLDKIEKDFSGKTGEVLFSYIDLEIDSKVLLVGLGSKIDDDSCRRAFAEAVAVARKRNVKVLTALFPTHHLTSSLDGMFMANYSYDLFKKEPSKVVEKVMIVGSVDLQAQVDKQLILMRSIKFTQDLVNGNADEVHASHLAKIATEISKQENLELRVLRKKELELEKMNLILAVNQGAKMEPALIVLKYNGDPDSKDVTALVGKGITFDSGGLNIKPTGSIETMKADMAGAAAVLGAMKAISALKIKKNVIGVIAVAENATGSLSYKPGDVFRSHLGKSVEITNTDAEGRLVLADAFSYIQKYDKPSRMIDFATLTGGVIIALGEEASGLFSNSEELVSQMNLAAQRSGERVWHMPIYPEYEEALKSPIADLKNSRTGRKASAGSGAAFLKQFVLQDLPWIHLDIAGTAYLSELSAYYPSYATGVGVKLITEFLQI